MFHGFDNKYREKINEYYRNKGKIEVSEKEPHINNQRLAEEIKNSMADIYDRNNDKSDTKDNEKEI